MPAHVAARDFKIALGGAPGGPQHAFADAFVEALVDNSEGELTGTLFPLGRLGSEQSTVDQARRGLIDIAIVESSNLVPFAASVGVLELPYLLTNLEDAQTLLQGQFSRTLRERVLDETNLRILGWTYSGFRVLTNSVRPIASVSDLEGLRMRVPNELVGTIFESWGGEPVPMSWGRMRSAIEDGVLDGQNSPILTVRAFALDAVQDHATELRYSFLVDPMLMSERIFQSLSEQDQKYILSAGYRATRASAAYLTESEAEARLALVEGGMTFTAPSDAEREFEARARAAVWPRYLPRIGEELVERALRELGRENEAPSEGGASGE